MLLIHAELCALTGSVEISVLRMLSKGNRVQVVPGNVR